MFVEALPDAAGSLLHLKVVPGASRTVIAGAHGDRLRIRVAAAPEKGRANRQLRRLLARTLGVRTADVTVVRGATSPRKTVRVEGLDPIRVRDLLAS